MKSLLSTRTELLTVPPPIWDGFGFYTGDDGKCKFFFFDDVAQKYGELPGDPNIPADRKAYHVLLCSVRKNRVHIEPPFTSNFLDPFTYAEHIARSGFTGVMIKENKYSLAVAQRSLLEIMQYHAKETGFMFTDEHGKEQWHQGLKKEKTS